MRRIDQDGSEAGPVGADDVVDDMVADHRDMIGYGTSRRDDFLEETAERFERQPVRLDDRHAEHALDDADIPPGVGTDKDAEALLFQYIDLGGIFL